MRQLVDPKHPHISIQRQCELLGLSRSSYYYQAIPASEEEPEIMKLIDRQYMETPFYGSRRMAHVLSQELGVPVNRKRVIRLMRVMGIEALYPKPKTSTPGVGHRIFPYLLRGFQVDRANQVWSSDITYIPMRHGFLYQTEE